MNKTIKNIQKPCKKLAYNDNIFHQSFTNLSYSQKKTIMRYCGFLMCHLTTTKKKVEIPYKLQI